MSCKEEFYERYFEIINKVIDYLDEILKGLDIDYEFVESEKDLVFFDSFGYLIVDAYFYVNNKRVRKPILELELEKCRDGYKIVNYRILVKKGDIVGE
jgi:hypothetical protein